MSYKNRHITGMLTLLLSISLISYGAIAIGSVLGMSKTIWPLWYLGLVSGLGLLVAMALYMLIILIAPLMFAVKCGVKRS